MAFFYLYFLGDFEINDVNVRDFLQSVITPEQLQAARLKVMGMGKTIYSKVNAGDSQKQNAVLDQLSEDDKQKMMELIEQNLDPKKLEEQNHELQKTLEKILIDSRREDQVRMMQVLHESLKPEHKPARADPNLHKTIDKIARDSL
jgi:hypothetical protein